MADQRTYPQRPYLAVSAAIVRDGKVLVVRRARNPALNLYTLPGGVVETGETLTEAVSREVREETALEVEPVALAGHREVIVRDAQGRVERHFVILCFAARWRSGEAGAQRRTRRCALARAGRACRPAHHRRPGRDRRRRHRASSPQGLRRRLAIAAEHGHIMRYRRPNA